MEQIYYSKIALQMKYKTYDIWLERVKYLMSS